MVITLQTVGIEIQCFQTGDDTLWTVPRHPENECSE